MDYVVKESIAVRVVRLLTGTINRRICTALILWAAIPVMAAGCFEVLRLINVDLAALGYSEPFLYPLIVAKYVVLACYVLAFGVQIFYLYKLNQQRSVRYRRERLIEMELIIRKGNPGQQNDGSKL